MNNNLSATQKAPTFTSFHFPRTARPRKNPSKYSTPNQANAPPGRYPFVSPSKLADAPP